MSNENSSIHDFDFSLICEYFSTIERQGPGSPEATLKALSFIDNLGETSQIADIGCGTGGQTMTLAKNTTGSITGIDLFSFFIELFNKNAAGLNLQDRVKGIAGNMAELPFEKESLDLIWSEGAIYNIGFEKGLREWHQFLKHGAYIVVTDASWFTVERPDEINKFWQDAYPEIDLISNKVAQMEKAGYVPVSTFILPEKCWLENFYDLQVGAQERFLEKYAGNEAAENLVANERHEAVLYKKYKEYYGYVFYIGRKL
jgi:ubiquinone/menaquinone biosynthesis C-methylase UbiE